MAITLPNILDTIGNTPLVKLTSFQRWIPKEVSIFAKLESKNPGGSVKDRAAKKMILEAVRSGELTREKTILDSSSGNTGIGYALIAAALGYKLELVMPENASEKKRTIEAFGAKVIFSDPLEGSDGAILEAQKRFKENPGKYYMPDQYNNPNNWKAHYETTGPEIWFDTEGRVDILISGVGTGGTITGVSQFIKAKNPAFKAIAVEPAASPVLSGKPKGPHKIQGIGAGFVPKVLDMKLVDEVVTVTDDDAFDTARRLAAQEGLLCGISSGAAIWAAVQVAKRPENAGKCIVTVLPSTGERYISTPLFQ